MVNRLDEARVYGAACRTDRTERLLSQIRNLGIADWQVAVEKPAKSEEYGKIVLDPPSRRFRRQLTVATHRPFVWLEDDADIPPDFKERIRPFFETLPNDWKIAVIGWGLLFEDIGCKFVNDHWLQITSGHSCGFAGLQCAVVNSGEWRHELSKWQFRCDNGLPGAMKDAGIEGVENGLYLSRTILVGTNDPLTTFGEPVVQYPVYSKPMRFSWKKHGETGNGYSELEMPEMERNRMLHQSGE